jgi:hypothetical protein
VNATYVAIQPEDQDVSQVGIHFHPPEEHQRVLSGEASELMPVPGPAVLGKADPVKPPPFGLPDQLFGGETGIGTATDGMDMEINDHIGLVGQFTTWRSEEARMGTGDCLLTTSGFGVIPHASGGVFL